MKQYITPFVDLLCVESEDILTISNGVTATGLGDVWSFEDDFIDVL
jgi:hypothetical protein